MREAVRCDAAQPGIAHPSIPWTIDLELSQSSGTPRSGATVLALVDHPSIVDQFLEQWDVRILLVEQDEVDLPPDTLARRQYARR